MRPLVALGLAMLVGLAEAQPVPGNAIHVDDVTLYPDYVDKGLFYYPPGRLKLSTRSDGSPELSFLQIRYVGTGATDDRGKFLTRSAFSFRMVMEHRPDATLRALKRDLERQVHRGTTLMPLPISAFETHLLYTPVGSDKVDTGKGEAETLGGWSPTEYWTERVVSIYPNTATSQLLADLLKKGQAAMSVTYAFVTHGASADGDEKAAGDFTALADTIPIIVDLTKYPDALRQIDLNERAPANFPLLNVYCFDFRDGPKGEQADADGVTPAKSDKPDFLEKQVEIEATGVTGKSVGYLVRFRKLEKDVYSAKARFKFAINMRKGYRYRVRTVQGDGTEAVSDWLAVSDWSRVLDVTAKGQEKL